MIRYILAFIALLSLNTLMAQEQKGNSYSGGMLIYQPGWLVTSINHHKISTHTNAIGGILRFYFFDYLTVGIYGGRQNGNYKTEASKNSYLNLGYGGLFVGGNYRINKLRITASVYGGMGGIKNLHIAKQEDNYLNEAYFHNYLVAVASPIISLDYFINKRITLTLQSVCLMEFSTQKEIIYNPTLQIGILFNK